MNRNVLKIMAIIIALIFAYIGFNIASINYNEKIKEYLKYKNINTYVFDDKIQVKYKPFPVISIKNIYIENMLSIGDAKIEMSLFSLISRSIAGSKITLSNVAFKHDSKDKEISRIQLLNSANKLMRYFDDLNISVYNISVLGEENDLKFRILELKDSSQKLSIQLKKDLYLELSRINNQTTKISAKNANKYSIELIARYDQEDNLIDADFLAKSINISYLLEDNYIGQNTEENKKINITCKIINSKDGIDAKNLNITGEGIEGSGEINDLGGTPSINFVFNYIDLNKLIGKEDTQNIQISSIDKDMNFDIRINNLIYKNESFNKITISLLDNKKSQTLEIKKFSGAIKSGGIFSFVGNVENDSYRSVFDGRFIVKHNNINNLLKNIDLPELSINEVNPLTVISNLHISDTEFVLNDLFARFSNINTMGSISIKMIGKTPRINSILSISDIDLNQKYPIISEIAGKLSGFFDDMQNEDYVTKYNPLRTMSHIGNYYFNIANIKSNNMIAIDSISLSASAMKNLLSVNFFSAKNKDLIFNSAITVDTSVLNPKIELKIQDSVINSYSTMLNFFDLLYKNFDTKNIAINIKGQNNSVEDFANNIEFEIKNDKRIINITNLSANLKNDNSKIKLLGNLMINPFKANLGYYIENMDLSKNLYSLAFSPAKVGLATIGGTVSLVGNNINEIFANSYAEGSLNISKGEFQGFSVDDFIASIRNPKYNGSDINDKASKYANSGITKISSMGGQYKLNKGIFSFNNFTLSTTNSSGKLNGFTNLYTQENKLSYAFDFYLSAVEQNNRIYSAIFDMSGKINDGKKNISIGDNVVEYFSKLRSN
jgi:hypothetical protein